MSSQTADYRKCADVSESQYNARLMGSLAELKFKMHEGDLMQGVCGAPDPARKIPRWKQECIGGPYSVYYLWGTAAVDDLMLCDNCQHQDHQRDGEAPSCREHWRVASMTTLDE